MSAIYYSDSWYLNEKKKDLMRFLVTRKSFVESGRDVDVASTTAHAVWCVHWVTVFDNTYFLSDNVAAKAVTAT
ncbi:hypothetical protein PHYBLDRAFT_139164 [Phycomyces blakesleeanus NRRL 1555(-)]|uniref:Uncharacterized protein n=1 Tax=Phycomyces blakesleeanus (strain ATCC 8743b / DSM 1359 / FGSC 10004 / NBRC 33097 / NRRL 1555) TaxID=763407 RepID=A0A167Q5Y0_PHYB8|nr:hypothetical protein PHYBLDRAFT_139164 [Phycomyces blakesleeanus NRRL 1555(-)]OAD79127.1 hypothetical protein PHYBLDRAFT_139164 [Phycomyces blakesleeanus NRRL 1555(-)]|eukprot:XP_018297167.1 hypothetical protein PHYBLDRAFT_139164 [Phycomyces blakesleeanus NRRL 1555(-)]